MVRLPPEMLNHIGQYMAEQLRAADPQCYRAARIIQAAYRGRLVRTHGDPTTSQCARFSGPEYAHSIVICFYCYSRKFSVYRNALRL